MSTANSDRKVPTQVVSSGVVSITAGAYNALFIKDDGSLWGMGARSPLGNTGGSRSPIKIHDSGWLPGKYWQASFIHD